LVAFFFLLSSYAISNYAYNYSLLSIVANSVHLDQPALLRMYYCIYVLHARSLVGIEADEA